MSDMDEFFPSKFLRAANVEHPVNATITKTYAENVQSKEGEQRKPVVEFAELEKPLVLNKTNFRSIAEISGSENMKDWPGTVVNLYVVVVDAWGEETPAIRVRRPQK